jgi:hypothetical protein
MIDLTEIDPIIRISGWVSLYGTIYKASGFTDREDFILVGGPGTSSFPM